MRSGPGAFLVETESRFLCISHGSTVGSGIADKNAVRSDRFSVGNDVVTDENLAFIFYSISNGRMVVWVEPVNFDGDCHFTPGQRFILMVHAFC